MVIYEDLFNLEVDNITIDLHTDEGNLTIEQVTDLAELTCCDVIINGDGY